MIDLDKDTQQQMIVVQHEGQYLGHIFTVRLADGHTILAVYPRGNGKVPLILGVRFKLNEFVALTQLQMK